MFSCTSAKKQHKSSIKKNTVKHHSQKIHSLNYFFNIPGNFDKIIDDNANKNDIKITSLFLIMITTDKKTREKDKKVGKQTFCRIE